MVESAKGRHNAAAALLGSGDFEAAERSFRALLGVDGVADEARYMLGLALLSQGRYPEGFEHYAARWKIPGMPLRRPLPFFRRWAGEPLAGKRLLVWPEQGLGDQIMLSRFAFALAHQGVDVTLMTPDPLVRLFAGRSPAKVVSISGSYEIAGFDYLATDFDLAAHLVTDEASIMRAPYLFGAPCRRGGVGVMVRGNPNHVNDASRSMPIKDAAKLLALPGAFSLAPEDTGAKDMQETADIIAGLDLVISVDTSVAHLAGAMGKTAWVLLPARHADWRWLSGRNDSPWYPSVTLFRQRVTGDWTSVVAEVSTQFEPAG
jgi:hypothetical protein